MNELQEKHGAAGVKQQLAAVRMLFDWPIVGQVVPMNPAAAVRGPKHVVRTGKTPVLDGAEWRRLIDSIPTGTVRDLRDRALIATLTYSFARIGAALKMKVEDLRLYMMPPASPTTARVDYDCFGRAPSTTAPRSPSADGPVSRLADVPPARCVGRHPVAPWESWSPHVPLGRRIA